MTRLLSDYLCFACSYACRRLRARAPTSSMSHAPSKFARADAARSVIFDPGRIPWRHCRSSLLGWKNRRKLNLLDRSPLGGLPSRGGSSHMARPAGASTSPLFHHSCKLHGFQWRFCSYVARTSVNSCRKAEDLACVRVAVKARILSLPACLWALESGSQDTEAGPMDHLSFARVSTQ